MERIVSWGFNAVRLGYIWEGIEPERGEFDQEYLERQREIVRQFADNGVYVLIDMHQDLYAAEFGGDGAPAWAIYDGGYDYELRDPWYRSYFFEPAVQTAFDNFWTNKDGIQDEFVEAWEKVAESLSNEPNVLGYELFNEPTPGWRTVGRFGSKFLPDFYNRIIRRIRQIDGETPIWVEPPIYSVVGLPTRLGGVDDPAGKLVLSFHNYANLINGEGAADTPLSRLGLAISNFNVTRLANRKQRRLGVPASLTEYGDNDGVDGVDALTDAADNNYMGWFYWPYKESADGWNHPAEDVGGVGLVENDGSDGDALETLVRPYPRRVAGIPERLRYRNKNGFVLRYTPSSSESDGRTVVYVPEKYKITVSGGEISCRKDSHVHVSESGTGSVKIVTGKT
ncbi:MAG: cellulase family glycosylhydrolase [Halobacteria archaeon]|nr:cellulase family glycosylhydrolase [Halobacteria archaeon]